jgi:hypothetical protein
MRLAQQTEEVTAGRASEMHEAAQQPPPLPGTPDIAFFPSTASAKEKRTADELAAMIVADLSEVKGCPRRGAKVVVYGLSPWNAWLSFGTDAGPVHNKTELRNFFGIIIERLKRLYDIAS